MISLIAEFLSRDNFLFGRNLGKAFDEDDIFEAFGVAVGDKECYWSRKKGIKRSVIRNALKYFCENRDNLERIDFILRDVGPSDKPNVKTYYYKKF